MCGIAGKVSADRGRALEPGLLEAMCRALVHRGPDDEGSYRQGHVGLAMRRLKVIDLEEGRQPMANEDETLWIVFNGEIYNYQDLRRHLAAAGHRFRSASDTEVILHLYEDEGIRCLSRLRGMFAIALWDRRSEALVLARDRLGKKPLYYAHTKSGLTFASELGALLEDRQIERRIDPRAIDDYLTCLFIPSPRSIYAAVRKLPSASYAVYRNGTLEVSRYWSVDYSVAARRRPEAEYLEELRSILTESVRLRLISDVPLGVFLSGGLDSTIVAHLAAQLSGHPVRTFSVGFTESSFDELEWARLAARSVGAEHHEAVVDYRIQELLPCLVAHFGEPFADSSALPVYHLSRMTRQYVTVALAGDGADEVFGGYRRYRARRIAEWYNRWPGWAGRRAADWLAGRLPDPSVYYGRSVAKKARRFAEYAAAVRADPSTSWEFFVTAQEKNALYREEFADILGSEEPASDRAAEPRAPEGDPVVAMLAKDLQLYLPDDILAKVDRMSMACSLEVRSPYLDHELVEFMATVPTDLKLRWGRGKYLLRRIAAGRVPEAILGRPKQGFAVPIAAWLRGPLREWARDALLSPTALGRELFRPKQVERMLSEHDRSRDLSQQLWALLVLELWHQQSSRLR